MAASGSTTVPLIRSLKLIYPLLQRRINNLNNFLRRLHRISRDPCKNTLTERIMPRLQQSQSNNNKTI